MLIGELADTVGVNPKTIRYYESIELMDQPERSASGYRTYTSSDVERLRFIRDAQATGLTLAQIGSVLELKDSGQGSCQHTRDLLDEHLHQLDDQIRQLQAARQELTRLAERASGLDPADCSDPNRCQVIGESPA